MTKAVTKTKSAAPATGNYSSLVGGIRELLDAARRASARGQCVNDGDLLGNRPAHRGI